MRPGGVVVRAVARTQPAAVVAALVAQRLALRDAAEVGADPHHDDPLLVALLWCGFHPWRAPNSGSASLRAESSRSSRDVDGLGGCDLLGRAVTDEDRLAAPQNRDRLADLDGRDVDLDRGERERARVRVHLIDERPQRNCAADGNEGVGREDDESPCGSVLRPGVPGMPPI